MGRFSRGIKKRQQPAGMPVQTIVYKKAHHINQETDKQINANLDRIHQVAVAYCNIYATYVLKKVFHVSSRKIDMMAKKIRFWQQDLESKQSTTDELVDEIIRFKGKGGCKYPDYQPSCELTDFDVAADADKYVNAGFSVREAIYRAKKLHNYEWLVRNAEIVTLVVLHDVLGFSRKRLKRYVDAFRKVRRSQLKDIKPILYELRDRYKWDLTCYIKTLGLDELEAEWYG